MLDTSVQRNYLRLALKALETAHEAGCSDSVKLELVLNVSQRTSDLMKWATATRCKGDDHTNCEGLVFDELEHCPKHATAAELLIRSQRGQATEPRP